MPSAEMFWTPSQKKQLGKCGACFACSNTKLRFGKGLTERFLRGFRKAKAKNKPFCTNKPCVSSEPARSSEEMNLKDTESLNQ